MSITTREMHIKERIYSMSINVVDSIIDELGSQLIDNKIKPALVVYVLVHLLTDATINDVKKFLALPEKTNKNSRISREIEAILMNITKRRTAGGSKT